MNAAIPQRHCYLYIRDVANASLCYNESVENVDPVADTRFSQSARLLYALMEKNGKKDLLSMGHRLMAKEFGMSTRTVHVAIKELAAAGRIGVRREPGKRSVYAMKGAVLPSRARAVYNKPVVEKSCIDGLALCPNCGTVVDVEEHWVGNPKLNYMKEEES